MTPQLAIYLGVGVIVGLIAQARIAAENGGGIFTRVWITVVAGWFWPITILVAATKSR